MIVAAVRRAITRGLLTVPPSLWAKIIPRREFVFTYHLLSDTDLPHVKALYPCKKPWMFGDDLECLQQKFDLVSYEEFARRHARPTVNSRPLAMITFDDGMEQCFSVARPLLLQRQAPAVFFVVADFIDNRTLFYRHKISLCVVRLQRATPDEQKQWLAAISALTCRAFAEPDALVRYLLSQRKDTAMLDELCSLLGIDAHAYLREAKPYLSAEQIKLMAQEGLTIGAHSLSHPDFRRLDAQAIEREIAESCARVCEVTESSSAPFAFPHGIQGLDRQILRGIASRNPKIGLMFGTQGLLLEAPFVHRISADSPQGASLKQSNLPKRLHEAYARYPTSLLSRLLPQ